MGGTAATPGPVGTSLPARQREAVETAIAVGYYDIPRGGGDEAIAAEMGRAPGTAAERLRKAE